jgi:hypothetical protein
MTELAPEPMNAWVVNEPRSVRNQSTELPAQAGSAARCRRAARPDERVREAEKLCPYSRYTGADGRRHHVPSVPPRAERD